MLVSTGLLLMLAGPLPCGQPVVGDQPVPNPPPPIVILGPGPKLERDPFGVPNALASTNFRVLWGNTNPIEPPQAMALLDAMERSWDVEIVDMGHPQPPGSETYLINVYVGNTGDGTPDASGVAGYYLTDPEGYAMMAMNRDVVAMGGGVSEGTAAHEFYHALQATTGRFPYDGISAWLWESTATWMEYQVFPEHPGYATFLFGYAYLPHYPLSFFDYFETGALTEYFQYGAFIFPHYLTQQVTDATIVRDTWLDPTFEPDPLMVIASRLDAEGLDFSEVWLDHVAHNVLWDYEDHDNLLAWTEIYTDDWPESSNRVIAEVPSEGTDGFVQPPFATFPRRYGSNAIRIATPVPGNLHVQLRGVVDGDAGTPARWGGRIVREYADHIEYEPIAFTLGELYEGEALVEGVGDEVAIWLVVGAWTDEHTPFDWMTETFGYQYAVTPEEVPMGTTGGSSDTGEGESSGQGSSGGLDSTTGAGVDGGSSSGATATGETDTAPAASGDDSGCGCRATSRSPAGLLVLLLLGLTTRRRPRSSRDRP